MIPVRSDVRIWLATGCTDMRRGMFGLALQVQQGLKRDPHAGDLYIFRGRHGIHPVRAATSSGTLDEC
ncbi:IS66 family insertion sequence element accessory protein TnpB [Sphingomonas sp. 37zxx]|uniref:IS66 family insertion sequence element accessory protein TnpB n=1 Tax=Sphingomonas sp. 37zxx TaxID=1550073 RepID=UPI0012E03D60